MKIGIIGAMEPEVALLKAQMTVERRYDQARMQFVEGLLGEVPVVVVQSGIGKVNAAACTQILIDTFAVTHVINTGIAGLLSPELQVGDIVISSDLVQHDMNVGPLNFAAGQIPGLPVFSFTADESLIERALASAKEVAPQLQVISGRVASGDQFVSSSELADYIYTTFGADCCEMEGASIAQVAWLNHTPFVVIRLMSDKPGTTSSVDYLTFEREASERSARITAAIIKKLA